MSLNLAATKGLSGGGLQVYSAAEDKPDMICLSDGTSAASAQTTVRVRSDRKIKIKTSKAAHARVHVVARSG